MSDFLRRRVVYVLLLVLLAATWSSLLAQDTATDTPLEITPSETPTDIPTATATEIPTDTPTAVPTEVATEIPTEPATDIPTEIPTEILLTETAEPITETATPSPTLDATTETPAAFSPEPALSLLKRELFEAEPLIGWTLPAGWTRAAVSDGFALHVDAQAAGLDSAATLDGLHYNVVIMGYFTFADPNSAAQLIVRDSLAGSYAAQVDANGLVTLEKRDSAGTVVALWNGIAAAQAEVGAARALRLSAVDSVLRVAVDNVEVLAVDDTTPLPPGNVKIGAQFSRPADGQSFSSAILFDNFFLWVPARELSLYAPMNVPPTPLPTETVIPTSVPAVSSMSGKSIVPEPPDFIAGAQATTNNDIADRTTVIVPFSDSGDMTDNSVEVNEPTPSCGFNISKTAWYAFTPPPGLPTSEQFVISTVGSSFDTLIGVYTGTGAPPPLTSLTEVGCSDDVGGSTQAKLTTTLTDGVTYYIQLGGYNGSSGNFSLAILRPAEILVPGTPVISATAVGAPSTPMVSAGKTNLLQPVLAWNATGSVVPYSYEIQVATTSNFAVSIATGIVYEPNHYFEITPALSEPALPAGQVYYWRVRARNFLLQSSAWSAIYSFTLDRVAPPPPNLTAPLVNGEVTSLRPIFSWQPIPDVNRYQIQVTTNFSCTTLVSGSFDVQVSTTSIIFPTDLPQGEYWFCVQAKDIAGNWSGFAEKRHFVVNISLTPANNTNVVVTAPATTAPLMFKWTAVPGATYNLDVATDSSFTAMVLDNQSVAGASYTLVGQPFGTYYWRVKVNGYALPSSLAHHLTLTPPLPAAPAIQTVGALTGAVKNVGFTNDTTPILDWTIPANWVVLPAFQSITYEVQLSTNNTFIALVSSTITGISTDNFEWTATTLASTPGTLYYWRVRAMTNLGLYGNWSAPFSFTLDTTEPNPPASLTAPVDNFVSTTARPAFSWKAPLGGASSYRFEISTGNTDFDPPALPDAIVTTLSYVPTVSLPQGTYYWQVWARDAAGNESLTPTAFRTLTVDYRTAPVPNYAAITATSSNVTFSWMLVAGAQVGTTYTIEIDADFDGNADTPVSGVPAVTTASTIASGLAQGDYQYRLVVSNGFGTSGWRTFFVSAPLPGQPLAPFSPLNNAITADSTPQLTWNAPTVNPGAVTGYWVEISTTSNFSAPIIGSPFDAGASPNFTPPILTDHIYYWRVQARNSLGAKGAYSYPWYFSVDTTPPNPPASLTAPVDNFVSTTARPAFSWKAPLGGASSYRFEISTDNTDFDPPAIPDAVVTTLGYVPTVSLPQGTYYWQVWARDAAGNESLTPTGFRTLIVDYRTAPTANFTTFTTSTGNVTFSRMLVAGAPVGTTYTIEIDADFDGNADTPVAGVPAVTTASTIVSGLAQGDYQYRLVVSNGFGTSGWRTFFVSAPLPGQPLAPFSPPSNAFVSNTTPLLTWTAPTLNPGNVAGYKVEISTTSNFSAPVAGSPFDAGASPNFTPPALTDHIYYWRVRAYNSLGIQGAVSFPWYFTVDTVGPNYAPNLSAPLDNATTNLPRPIFSWTPATGANRYLIEIDDESGFNNPLFHTATVTTASYALPVSTYLRQGIYYWRVWSMDAAGNLNPGPITSRTLKVNYAKTPIDNAVITSATSTNVTFTWTAVPIMPVASNALRIQIDDNSDFLSLDASSSPPLASNIVTYTTTLPLSHGKYYWRLMVNGHPVLPTTLARSFTISPAPPPAPVLSAPPVATNDTTPTFSWNTVASPAGATVTGYELQLSTTSNFAALVGGAPVMIAGGGTTSYDWAPELPATTGQVYYARIRAVTNLNIYSGFSAIRSFTLDTNSPAVPTLISPANNAVIATRTPIFSWAAVPGAVRYEIRYDTSPDLTSAAVHNVTTTSYKPTVLLPINNIYWEVRAIDAAGNAIDWITPSTWNPITNRRTVKITG